MSLLSFIQTVSNRDSWMEEVNNSSFQHANILELLWQWNFHIHDFKKNPKVQQCYWTKKPFLLQYCSLCKFSTSKRQCFPISKQRLYFTIWKQANDIHSFEMRASKYKSEKLIAHCKYVMAWAKSLASFLCQLLMNHHCTYKWAFTVQKLVTWSKVRRISW